MRAEESQIIRRVAEERQVEVVLLDHLIRIERSPIGRHGRRGINTRVARVLDEAGAGRMPPAAERSSETPALDDISLARLSLRNFLQFRNADLRPDTTASRPLCLVSGHNGYGKTSIVSAIHWALHGTLPTWCNQDPGRLVHSSVSEPRAKVEVEIELSSVFDGPIIVRRFVEYRRRQKGWAIEDHGEVVVSLPVSKKTHRSDDAEEWLHSRFPPDMLSYFAFDAESAVVQKLSGQAGEQLPDIRHVVEAALDITPIRKMAARCRKRARGLNSELAEMGDDRGVAGIEAELESLASDIARMEKERSGLTQQLDAGARRLRELRSGWDQLVSAIDPERRSDHELLEREAETLAADLRQSEETLSQFCADGLPVLILAGAIEQLSAGGATRSDDWRGGVRHACERVGELAAAGAIPWSEEPMPTASSIGERLARLLQPHADPKNHSGRPSLPSRMVAGVRVRAETARRKLPVASLPHRVEELKKRRDAVRTQLRELAQPALPSGWKQDLDTRQQSLAEATADLDAVERKAQSLESDLQSAHDLRGALDQSLEESRQRDGARQELRQRVSLADRAGAALEEIAGQLLATRVAVLERAATTMLRRTAHKVELFEKLTIDPVTLRYAVLDATGRHVPPGRSTGERTILALCLVYGLQKTAGCRFPLVLEAPLKPLDPDHQEAVLRHFLTAYSGQTVLLVKPGEIPPAFLELCQNRIATTLRLIRPRNEVEWTRVEADRKGLR